MSQHPGGAQLSDDRAAASATARLGTAALLVVALLGFLLPFATVSCGTPVAFTGLELATATIPADGVDEEEFAGEIEHNGSVVAAIALVSVVVGLVLVLARRRGSGAAAVAGMLALLLLPWISVGALADFELHEGYVLSVGALAVVAAVRRVESVRARRLAARRVWPAVLAGVLLALPLAGAVLLAAAADV